MRARPTSAGLLVSVLVLAGLVFTASGAELPALTFIRGMLGAIKAPEIDCPPLVVDAVTNRGMDVVCARFEGSFESFRSAWDSQHDGEFENDALDSVRGQPRTDWEPRGENYERIYTVGPAVIGVRFWNGHVLLVYT
jgi:hypothetical protein